MTENEYAFKICLFGDSGAGKTTLTNRYLTGAFKLDLKQTMGAQIFVKYLDIEGIRIVLQIWDFGGEENFRFLLPNYAVGSSGGIFMYDISNKKTIESIDIWLSLFNENLMENRDEIPVIMVGGKSDLEEEREVLFDDAQEIAKSKEMIGFMETSAKTGENVDLLFEKLVRRIMQDFDIISAQ